MTTIHGTYLGGPVCFDVEHFRGAWQRGEGTEESPAVCIVSLDGNEVIMEGTLEELLDKVRHAKTDTPFCG